MRHDNETDCDLLLDAAVDVAKGAGKIARQGFDRPMRVSVKLGQHDLLTAFDIKIERYIISKLKKRFPTHGFVAEESGLQRVKGSVRWIIDPVDGTLNFCRAIPYFAVSIAAESDGELVCGVVYNPMSGELFHARKGGGAWLGGRRLAVSTRDGVGKSVLAIGFPFSTAGDPGRCVTYVAKIARKGAQLLRMGSTALNLAYVAAGRFDGFWETSFYPWDVAAGVVIVGEAGGVVTNFDGNPFDLNMPGIIAGNRKLCGQIARELAGI